MEKIHQNYEHHSYIKSFITGNIGPYTTQYQQYKFNLSKIIIQTAKDQEIKFVSIDYFQNILDVHDHQFPYHSETYKYRKYPFNR